MVLVAGGGFAGRIAAGRIARAGLPVTLVDPRPAAVERTRLHQLAARDTAVEWPLDAFAAKIGADWIRSALVSVDGDRALLADGRVARFDQLLVATGSTIDDGGVPGVADHAVRLNEPADAVALRTRLEALPDGARIVVVGAGLTGLELVTELAEAHPRLRATLIGRPADLSANGERIVDGALAALNVDRVDARVTRVDATGLETDHGRLDADLVAWTGGMRAAGWLAGSGLPVDPHGRLVVDATLRVPGHERVFAAGDSASTELRMACATAMPMGCHAADSLIRAARGEDPVPFRFGYALRCVSLGRTRALMQGVDAHDAPTWALGGRPAAMVKETILWAVPRMPDWEAGSGVPLYGWPRADVRRGEATA